ncbi:MAG: malectin domain-containing carbohydrate-binding protein, partial [Roseibacillus sp.]|nr:malectin domain-containing carbohydrate-binding protein [Roseibacillus sp.]
APPGDVPGQRVFDVLLNGETVLTDFDIVRESGRPEHGIWREFSINIDSSLVIDLVAKTEAPTLQQTPFINAVAIIREETKTSGIKIPEKTLVNEIKNETSSITFRAANHRNTVTLESGEQKDIKVHLRNNQTAGRNHTLRRKSSLSPTTTSFAR